MVSPEEEKRPARDALALLSIAAAYLRKAVRLRPNANAADSEQPELSGRVEPEVLDPLWIVHMLRLGFFLAILTVLGDLAQSFCLDPQRARLTLPYDLLELAASLLAAAFSFEPRFTRQWKAVTLGYCLFLVGVAAPGSVMLGEQVRLFTTILVLLTATCALVPWETQWQATLTAGFLAVATIDTVVARPTDAHIGVLWLATMATSVLALVSNRLWAAWRLTLAETCRRLEGSETQLRKLLDANLDEVSVVRLSNRRFIYVNDEFLKRGYRREQILGKSVRELGMWADDAELEEFMRKLSAQGFVRNREVGIRMADGRVVPHLISSVLIELNGESCVLSAARDIAELKKIQNDLVATQRSLQQSEAKLRKIFEVCPATICINSLRDGRYIEINPRFDLTGYTREEMMRNPSATLAMWASRKQFSKFGRELVERGVVHNMEADFRMKDGRLRPCLVSGAIVELDGEPCAVTFTSDIARLKRAESELVAAREAALAASRSKSEFLSSMSHEIRTPMNAILGMADLLAETPLTPEQRKFVETMTGNGNVLLELINGILDLAKVESGRLYLEETGFDLDEVVERAAETLSGRAHEKGLELATRILPDVPLGLIGDPLRLRQVLINLVGNAIKFTESGEVLLVVENYAEAETDGNGGGKHRLRFSVRDTGIGIPGEKLETIFQAFTQADSSVTRRYGGSGLGLAIARRLVELMGGEIWAESTLAKGSTFCFTARFKAAMGPRTELAQGPSLGGLRALLVDHNATSRLILREILSSRGAGVGEAAGAKQALAEIERARAAGEPYRLALLNSGLPEMDGFELAQRLGRQGDRAPAIIIMLTSEDLNPKLARVREMGLAYLVKPVKRSELMQAVAAIAGKGQIADWKSSMPQPNGSDISDRKPLRILMVEDSRDNRMLIEAYLKNLPYEVSAADNGEVAVEKFMRRGYDLVLMDMQMPVMDGYTATRKIRLWEREQNRPPTPIVALTASALDEDVRNALEAGCTAHLSKPVKKSRLLALIRELMGTSTASPSDRRFRRLESAGED